MKKIYLATVAMVLATAAFSQARFGVQVIGNAGTASISGSEMKNADKNMQAGIGAGLVGDFSLGEKFGIRSSLNFLQKKSDIHFEMQEFPGKPFSVKSTLNYLELPVQAVFKIPMNNLTAFVGAGPSFGYGLDGTLKAKGWMEEDGEGNEIIPFSAEVDAFKKEADDGAELKRFDISANAIAGVSLNNGLYVHAGYLLGLNNLAEGDKYKTRGIQLTVGFLLPSKR